jgi:hypothetical protein
MNNHRAAFDTATEILKTDPNDLTSLTEIAGYGLTLLPAQANAQLSAQNKADLDTVEKTSRYILANLDKIYAADRKPQGTTDDQWNGAKPTMQKFAQFTIARVAVTAPSKDAVVAMSAQARVPRSRGSAPPPPFPNLARDGGSAPPPPFPNLGFDGGSAPPPPFPNLAHDGGSAPPPSFPNIWGTSALC